MDSLSVIVPAHNNAGTIRQALQSVEEALQRLADRFNGARAARAEVVVVDDGSTDGTGERARDFARGKSQYTVIRRAAASSPSCARNVGVAASSGDLLFFLDGDDRFLPDHLAHCCQVLSEAGADFVKTGVRVSDPVHPDWQRRILGSLVINLGVRRRCHEYVGGFPDYHVFRREGDEFRHCTDVFFKHEDMYYNLLLARLFRGVEIHADTVEYHRHPGNSFDRQYDKFQKPFGAHQEQRSDEDKYRGALCELLVERQARTLEATRAAAGFSADWFSPHIPDWERLLGPLKGRPDLTFLEVGSFEGRSASWLLENVLTHPSSSLYCVDTFEGSVEHAGMDLTNLYERFLANTRAFGSRVRVLREPSLRALSRLQLQAARFDFIYIDGSHAAADVLADAVLSFPLLKVGGLLAFDDYQYPLGKDDWDRPRLAIDAFLHTHRPKCEVVHTGYQVFLRKTSS